MSNEPKFERRKIEPSKIPLAVRAKWSGAVLDEGFAPFPKRLLRVLSEALGELNWGHLQVILALVDYLRPDLARGPSIDFLAFTAGMEKAEFQLHLKDLIEGGLVEVHGPEEAMSYNLNGLNNLIERLSQ